MVRHSARPIRRFASVSPTAWYALPVLREDINVSSSLLGGIAAFLIGAALATATAFGIVQSQQSAGTSTTDTTRVSYGNN